MLAVVARNDTCFSSLLTSIDRGAQQRPIHRREALQCWTTGWRRRGLGPLATSGLDCLQLRRQFGVAGLKQADERTRGERAAHRLDFRELVAAAKDFEELRSLLSAIAETTTAYEDDAPRHNRDHPKDEQHTQRQRRPGDQIEDGGGRAFGRNSSWRLQQQGG